MEIKVTQRQVFGQWTIYPVCVNAQLFAKLIGKKTFSLSDLGIIMQLGYTVTTVSDVEAPAIPVLN